MVALGVFEGDRVELIRGSLVEMAPNDPEHASPIDTLNALLVRALGDRALVRIQQPIVAGDESEPEPDVAVVPPGRYAREHPSAAYLVIEVAASSLRKDREVKAPLYAASGFEEYWIVNVAERVVEVHRGPTPEGYASSSRHAMGAILRPLAFADITVPVSALFE